jgi:ribulose kinase
MLELVPYVKLILNLKVRAGIVNVKNGKLIASHSEEIQTWNPFPLHYEQSSNDIWNSTNT